jgi:hypothetical protein
MFILCVFYIMHIIHASFIQSYKCYWKSIQVYVEESIKKTKGMLNSKYTIWLPMRVESGRHKSEIFLKFISKLGCEYEVIYYIKSFIFNISLLDIN